MKRERIIWIASLLTVIAWGAMRGEDNANTTTATAKDVTPLARAERLDRLLQATSGTRDKHTGSTRASDGKGLETRTIHALRRSDPLERMAGLLKILESCDKHSIEQVIAAWKELKSSGIELPAEEALLNFRMGQLMGEKTLVGTTGTTGDLSTLPLVKSRFEGWIQAEPQAATRWLEELPPGKFRDQLRLSAIASTARDDPAEAIHQVSILPEHLRQTAGREVGRRLRETESIESGSEILKTLENHDHAADETYLAGIFEALLNGATKDDAGGAIRLIESHMEQPFIDNAALARASADRGKNDPVAALEWAATVEKKKNDLPQGSLMAASVHEMNLENLAKAEEWALSRQGTPGITEMLASLDARKQAIENRGNDENEYDKDD